MSGGSKRRGARWWRYGVGLEGRGDADTRQDAGGKGGGDEGGNEEQKEIKDNIQNIRQQLEAEKKKRDDVQQIIDQTDDIRRELQARANQIGAHLNYKNPKDLEDQIKKLEYQLSTSSASQKSEKFLIGAISSLTNSRKAVSEYHECNAKLSELTAKLQPHYEKIKEIAKSMRNLRELENAEYTKLNELRNKNKPVQDDRAKLAEKKQKIRGDIEKIKAEIVERKAKFGEEKQQYSEQRSQIVAEIKEEYAAKKKAEAERRKKEAEERQKKREAEEEYRRLHPYDREIDFCKQLVEYLQSELTGQAEQEAAATSGPSTSSNKFTNAAAVAALPKNLGLITSTSERPLNVVGPFGKMDKKALKLLQKAQKANNKQNANNAHKGSNGKTITVLGVTVSVPKKGKEQKPQEEKQETTQAEVKAEETTTPQEGEATTTPTTSEEKKEEEKVPKRKKFYLNKDKDYRRLFATLKVEKPQFYDEIEATINTIKEKQLFYENYKPEEGAKNTETSAEATTENTTVEGDVSADAEEEKHEL